MREFPELLPCPTTPRAVRAYLEFGVTSGQALEHAWSAAAGAPPAARDAVHPPNRAHRARTPHARKGRRKRLNLLPEAPLGPTFASSSRAGPSAPGAGRWPPTASGRNHDLGTGVRLRRA